MSMHVLVLPGGGYAEHAPHEAEPIVDWLSGIGVQASVFRYPLNARHPQPCPAPYPGGHRRPNDHGDAMTETHASRTSPTPG
ncbi:hypothetical protein [Streptomyces hirsutus]|uniref:hypothetical protein n=1 Tax=Streptomyces hirsutus TaxID=35620 RepID=UPI0036B98B02